MKRIKNVFLVLFSLTMLTWGCSQKTVDEQTESSTIAQDSFQVKADQFADLQILRYRVPGFEDLTAKEKELVYYLYEAALSGRDIIYDQNYKHNLTIRRTIESIVANFEGDTATTDYKAFMTYAKRMWFSNGIHHHYSKQKLAPEFSKDFFVAQIETLSDDQLPLSKGENKDQLIEKLIPILFDADVDATILDQTEGVDMVAASANNYYEGVTQSEVEQYYALTIDKDAKEPVMYGLNSKLLKENGKLVEKQYKVGGMYSEAIEKIVYWLQKASSVAENQNQKKALDLLVKYYQSGDLKEFNNYNIAWVRDTASVVDVVNGFIEVYGDALGYRAAYEAVVSIKDKEASEKMAAISKNAQWFEDNSPLMEEHKKKEVKGITYKVITVVVEAGDAAPSTPIGINLPNSDWIRKEHGSKSVSLGNISDAYTEASSGNATEEFVYGDEAQARAKKYGTISGKMHTTLHEVVGHASGQLNPGVGSANETLKNYASALEEARADLVSLYFIIDPKLVEIGVIPSTEVGKAQYDSYIRNGLMLQLNRIEPGANIEQAHMRNRQLVARWVYEKGKSKNVIEKVVENGKTYFVVNDYEKLRNLFGELLREIQRIKSEGDFSAGKALIETYGVKVDQELLKEVKERFATLGNAPYSGFMQPTLTAAMNGGKIVDVEISYPDDFVEQMMEYGKKYSFLPHYN